MVKAPVFQTGFRGFKPRATLQFMIVPFRLKQVPPYDFCGDGMFSKNRIIGRDKRMLKKKQIRKAIKDFLKGD